MKLCSLIEAVEKEKKEKAIGKIFLHPVLKS